MLENRAVHSQMFSVSLWSCVGYSYLSWAACLTCLKGSGLGNWKMLGSSIITRVAFGGWWLHLRSAGLMTFGWLWESWAPGKSLVNSCLQPGFLFKKHVFKCFLKHKIPLKISLNSSSNTYKLQDRSEMWTKALLCKVSCNTLQCVLVTRVLNFLARCLYKYSDFFEWCSCVLASDL